MAAEKQSKMMAMMEDMQATLLRLSSHWDMQKEINIDDYFPINHDADVAKFLDKSDGLFPKKRLEFESFLYCNVTRNLKLKRSFEASLLSIVFSRDFIRSHRWPGPRYYLLRKKKTLINMHARIKLKICG